jgi:hypothetical protein
MVPECATEGQLRVGDRERCRAEINQRVVFEKLLENSGMAVWATKRRLARRVSGVSSGRSTGDASTSFSPKNVGGSHGSEEY